MKGRLVAFAGVVCIACLVVSVAYAGKPDKPPKPPKPDEATAEWIAFTGDLIGAQEVEGCCPNDGPFPEYGMTLGFKVRDFSPGTYLDGQLFINRYGAGRNQEYKVQFWNEDIAIEIIGGVIDDDKKNKVLTVTFTGDICVVMWTGDPIAVVTFTLIRTPY